VVESNLSWNDANRSVEETVLLSTEAAESYPAFLLCDLEYGKLASKIERVRITTFASDIHVLRPDIHVLFRVLRPLLQSYQSTLGFHCLALFLVLNKIQSLDIEAGRST